MQNTQQILVAVIFALVAVIGILVYDRHHLPPETFGEKLGHTIDHAADEFSNAVEEGSRRKR
ncbi:MAG: hypothetical protein EPN97_12560 [Alphaproteobacteria bacterium]|nr:MAG: hypothetical protein EPN97_12560 [Alphaproteobacteria bacterium]